MILIIDNYDSFTYNLVQYVGELGYKIIVYRNDQISPDEIFKIKPDKIIISPGPGRPDDAGLCLDIIKQFAATIPILGVCLGHQSIGQVFGGTISRIDKLMHGKTSQVFHDKESIFFNIETPFIATRYHSLIINKKNFPNILKIIAWTADGIIMACQHRLYSHVIGIQFHPESLWTEKGKKIIKNFLEMPKIQ